MERPLEDVRPIGPFAQMSEEVRNDLIEFELSPDGTFRSSPEEVEGLLRQSDVRADVVEDSSGVYVVKVREDINIDQLQKFVNGIESQMSIDPIRSVLVAPRQV